MIKQTIDILTSYAKPQKRCVMGNVAIARGAIEAAVDGVFAYPGTPSTEISEVFKFVNDFQNKADNRTKFKEQTCHKIYFEYSINEKIALEKAIAFSIGQKSAMCVMKNVGMNVACDALMSITYQTIIGPLVIVVCDDPGCHSSSNEQDSRYWGPMASVPVFNPSTAEDAKEMTKQAFRLSAEIKLPVIVRTTTRVSHSRNVITYGKINVENHPAGFDRVPEHINIPARTAAAHSRLLEKLKSGPVMKLLSDNSAHIIKNAKASLGIITSGVATSYLNEIVQKHNLSRKANVISLGMIHPFPEKKILNFLKKNYRRILVLEELDPFIENSVRTIAQKNKTRSEIYGKGFSSLAATGEYSVDIVTKALEDFLKIKIYPKSLPLTGTDNYKQQLPSRPPVLCSGCPHRATFYLLKLAIQRDFSSGNERAMRSAESLAPGILPPSGGGGAELLLCGDIGCFGLGALPPLKMIDTINHMGMSISMAQGLSEAARLNHSESGNAKAQAGEIEHSQLPPSGGFRGAKVVALLGDGTFFHSGLASLVNAVYTRANILVVIFDNRTIGMTGHQAHPGASQRLPKYQEIEIAPLLKGLGIKVVEEFNPFDLRDGFVKFNKAMAHNGVSVIISKSPCIFLPDFKEKFDNQRKIVIDEKLCNTCANHEDSSLACSRCYSPANNLSRARAKLFAKVSIPGEEQLCPANICNHGFFNSILEGDYKSAVEIVRDKMLFARTCGNICHRPCELQTTNRYESTNSNRQEKSNLPESYFTDRLPLKALKKFVSSIDENFYDFSLAKSRVKNAVKKNKKIAVVGAGPAGLSAAYDLIQAGYRVEIFEKESKAGGMVTFAIPNFRMDKTGFDYEAMQLKEMGVKFHFNTLLGKEFTLEELSEEFDSVILAIGLSKSKTLDVIEKNIPEEKRTDALEFLKKFNLKVHPFGNYSGEGGSTIFVIGGGNSAMDAARSAKKLNPHNKVFVSCIEAANAMPAFREEIEHAVAENIEFIHDSLVKDCLTSSLGKIGITLHSFSANCYLKKLECDFIITAIGQQSEQDIFEKIGKEKIDVQGRIKNEKGFSGYKNVFTAGDISSGNHQSVIGAIASGKKAAVAVRKSLENYKYEYEGEIALEKLNKRQEAVAESCSANHQLPLPLAAADLNKQQEAEVVGSSVKFSLPLPTAAADIISKYNLYQSCMKCNHCIDNFGCPAMVKINGKIKIDHSRCTFCGLCIDVCPNNAIRWEASTIGQF